MKITLLTNSLDTHDGWATVGYYLYEMLRKSHQITVITQNDAPITIHKIYKHKINKIPDSDLIICNIEPLLPVAIKMKNKTGAKLILIGHGTYAYYPFTKFPIKYYYKHYAKKIDYLITPSKYSSNKIIEWYKGKIKVINWGVDTKKYFPVNTKKKKQFISVGGQKPRKGYDLILRAMTKFPDYKILFVGNKNEQCEILAKKLGVNAEFTGKVIDKELIKLYSESLIHLLPSKNIETGFKAFEGYGLVHLEANACKIPSIGGKGTANEEVIINGKNGYLVSNEKELVNSINKILKNYKQISKTSLEHAKAQNWKKTMREINEIIKQLI